MADFMKKMLHDVLTLVENYVEFEMSDENCINLLKNIILKAKKNEKTRNRKKEIYTIYKMLVCTYNDVKLTLLMIVLLICCCFASFWRGAWL